MLVWEKKLEKGPGNYYGNLSKEFYWGKGREEIGW